MTMIGTVSEKRTHVAKENAGPRAVTEYTVTHFVDYSCPRCNTACDKDDYLCCFCGWQRNDDPWVCVCHCVNRMKDNACTVCGFVR